MGRQQIQCEQFDSTEVASAAVQLQKVQLSVD